MILILYFNPALICTSERDANSNKASFLFHSLAKYFQPPHQKERVHIKMHQINPRDQPYFVATAKVLKSHYSTNLQCVYIHENA